MKRVFCRDRRICANIVRLTFERNNNGKKIKPFLKIFERWGFKGEENFLKKVSSPLNIRIKFFFLITYI